MNCVQGPAKENGMRTTRRYTQNEKEIYIRKFQEHRRSGFSNALFTKETGVPSSTVYGWIVPKEDLSLPPVKYIGRGPKVNTAKLLNKEFDAVNAQLGGIKYSDRELGVELIRAGLRLLGR